MTAEETLVSVLNAAATVTALVSTRIYNRLVPIDKQLPAIAIRRTETEFFTTIHVSTVQAGRAQIEVACMADTVGAAENLGTVVMAALGTAGHIVVSRSSEEDIDLGTWAVLLVVTVWE